MLELVRATLLAATELSRATVAVVSHFTHGLEFDTSEVGVPVSGRGTEQIHFVFGQHLKDVAWNVAWHRRPTRELNRVLCAVRGFHVRDFILFLKVSDELLALGCHRWLPVLGLRRDVIVSAHCM
jgi:hypothetical protein